MLSDSPDLQYEDWRQNLVRFFLNVLADRASGSDIAIVIVAQRLGR